MANWHVIMDTIDELVDDFVNHDRVNDKELPKGEIERLIKAGEITIDEIVNKFKKSFKSHMEKSYD
jgi:hypothetical protein